MSKNMVFRFSIIFLLILSVSSCSRTDPESDFKVEPLDGGKSVRITEYVVSKFDVNIPSKIQKLPVSHIGQMAFRGKNLIKVTIPNSVTTIEAEAFANNQLTVINIPNNVTYLSGFSDNLLTNITIPNSVTTLGDGAFCRNQLTSINIPNNVTYLSGFSNNLLTNITIPDSVTTIGNNAFSYNQLANVIIPNSVVDIRSNAFEGNPLPFTDDYRFEIIGREINIIEYYGMEQDIVIPEYILGLPVTFIIGSYRNWGNGAFDSKWLTSVIIPDSVTYIGQSAFYRNRLTGVIIPNAVSFIGDHAFRDNLLTNVTLPDSLTAIGSNSFSGNNQLTSITIGANVMLNSSPGWQSFGYMGFEISYNAGGQQAGTYTRSTTGNTISEWIKQ